MLQRPTAHDFAKAKGRQKWVQLHVDSAAEAAAAVTAGVTLLGCEAETLEAVRAAAPTAFLQAGLAHGSVASTDEAIRAGFALLQRGADTVYCSHSPRFIEAMAREGIPVTGHVGLVPNLARFTGFRAVGREPGEAAQVVQKMREIEAAGASFLEVEVVPVELADWITRNTSMITMGMGCGTTCDTQYLFSCDVLGTHSGHYPRHSKRYADFVALEAELQAKRVQAFRAFAEDVAAGGYPSAEHEIRMTDAAQEAFSRLIHAK